MERIYRIREDNYNCETCSWERDLNPTHVSSMKKADEHILGKIEDMIRAYLQIVGGDGFTTFNFSIDMGHAKFRIEQFSKTSEYSLSQLKDFLKKNTVRKSLNQGMAMWFIRVGRFENVIHRCVKTDSMILW